MPWLLSLVFLATPSVNVSADVLETKASSWRARGAVTVKGPGWRLTAEGAEGHRSPDCPSGALVLEGEVKVVMGARRAHAQRVSGCSDNSKWSARKLGLRAPRLTLSADLARLEGETIEARGVMTTRCGCEDPPWRVTASAASLTLGEGAWLQWPVLWLGPVPIATVPRWYIPAARRRAGVLTPRLGFDGVAGFSARLPVFVTLGQSVDLTLSPGWRQTDGLTGAATLRWAASNPDRGEVRLDAFEDGLQLNGTGDLTWGPARLSLATDYTSNQHTRALLSETFEDRRRAHPTSLLGVTFASADVGMGSRVVLAQTALSADHAPEETQFIPQAWLRLSAPYDGGVLGFELMTTRFETSSGERREVLRVGSKTQTVEWLGPIRVQLEGGVLSHTVLIATDPGAPQESVIGFGTLDLRVEAVKRWQHLAHSVILAVTPRWAGVSGDHTAGAPMVALSSAGAALALTQRLDGLRWSGAVTVRFPYEARAPVSGWSPAVGHITVDTPWGRLDAIGTADGDLWARSGLEIQGIGLRAGLILREALTRVSPWRRRWGRYGPFELAPDDAVARTGRVGFTLPVSNLRVGYDAVLDLDLSEVSTHHGQMTYEAACDCLTVSLSVSKQGDRPLPDVFLTVGL